MLDASHPFFLLVYQNIVLDFTAQNEYKKRRGIVSNEDVKKK